ncbi:MAG TPA: hypothetical protein VJK54_10695 [Chthoniobacterales bacterium]|nr:hypothetical protein [Chthoniobacterales bacterium]
MKIKKILQCFLITAFTPCYLLAQEAPSEQCFTSSGERDVIEWQDQERMENLSSQSTEAAASTASIWPVDQIVMPHLCGGGPSKSAKSIGSLKVPVAEAVPVGGGGNAIAVDAIVIGMEAREVVLGEGEDEGINHGITAKTGTASSITGGRLHNRETAYISCPSAPRSELMFRDDEMKGEEGQVNLSVNSEVTAAKRKKEDAWEIVLNTRRDGKDDSDVLAACNSAVLDYYRCKNRVEKAAIFKSADRAWLEADAGLEAVNAAYTAKDSSTATSQARQTMLIDAIVEAEANLKPLLQRAYDAETVGREAYTQIAEKAYREAVEQRTAKEETVWTDRCLMNVEVAEKAVKDLTEAPQNMVVHRAADRAEFIAAIDRIMKLQATNELAAEEARVAEASRALEAKRILQDTMKTEKEKATELLHMEHQVRNIEQAEERARACREQMISCMQGTASVICCPVYVLAHDCCIAEDEDDRFCFTRGLSDLCEGCQEKATSCAKKTGICLMITGAVVSCPIWSPIVLAHECCAEDKWCDFSSS